MANYVRVMSQLTPKEIASWFRSQARTFDQMADTIEKTFSGGPMPMSSAVLPLKAPPGIAEVREALSQKARRAADIADEFGVTKAEIERLLTDPESGVEDAGRGWWRLKGTA
jgi:hypothetical protein